MTDTAVPLVVVVDDDRAVRESLDSLLRSVGMATRLFGSSAELLAGNNASQAACLILDVRLPGVSGLDFQEQLMLLTRYIRRELRSQDTLIHLVLVGRYQCFLQIEVLLLH